MSNPLLPFVNSTLSVATYQSIKEQLGQDELIFQAMNRVAHKRGFSFELPTKPDEVEDKHDEIVLSLKREVIQARRGLFFDLIEELHAQLLAANKLVVAERLLTLIDLPTPNDFSITLTQEGAWIVKWEPTSDDQPGNYVSLVVYERNQHQIVPWHVVEYINSGIVLFRRKTHTSALALMTIALEATLRDVLATRGYSFEAGVSPVDSYTTSHVDLDVVGNTYTLTYPQPMPKDPTSLIESGNLPIRMQIRRKIHPRKRRTDLMMLVPDFLLDYLSSNQVDQVGQPKTISGLGQALSVARDTEHLITASDLPPDLDDVLKEIRNNLLHLSTKSFNAKISKYSDEASDIGSFTLADFIRDEELVSAFVTDIPRFVNDQYVKLWRSGELI